MCDFVPERKDDEASDDEYCRESDEDVVAGISPASVVEHLCGLSERKTVNSPSQQSDLFCLPPQVSSVSPQYNSYNGTHFSILKMVSYISIAIFFSN